MLWIEGLAALVVTLGFVVYAFLAFKPEHVAHNPGRVRIGAGIQGLTIGLLLAFVIIPLRMQVTAAPAAASPWASLSFLPAFILLILIRRGALLRAPILSPFLRAFRRASLLKARDDAEKALRKLDEIEARGAPA
ncbi:MAG TPA: hypothetical protein PLS69_03140 [Terricaulis sp.]|nr:hypothetical protein [Terricaulis sp.]HRP12142.1 hypothetical protein [Terricaulis sp.]